MLQRLIDACREPGCPVCRVERAAVERYLENQFYENVNSPKWRDRLRSSLGFCHEHAWLAVDRRLGDALGFSILYRDIVNTVIKQLDEGEQTLRPDRHWTSLLRKVPEEMRTLMGRTLAAITPVKRCPACEQRDEARHSILTDLANALGTVEISSALQSSSGLCLSHLGAVLEHVRQTSTVELLLGIHRSKLEQLRAELDEFIRKSDYREIESGFGPEGDAWLRSITQVVGSRPRS
jgi:hypothetical protein